MSVPVNTKPNIFYSSKEYVATITDTDTLADGFYGTVILNKGTAFTVTLGAAANNSERTVKFINIGAGTVTISDGGTVATLEQNETCAVTCNGSDWYASDHSLYALKTNVLELNNTDAFTPDADYEPATKKYADDLVSGGLTNLDGGVADTNYGGTIAVDGGTA